MGAIVGEAAGIDNLCGDCAVLGLRGGGESNHWYEHGEDNHVGFKGITFQDCDNETIKSYHIPKVGDQQGM